MRAQETNVLKFIGGSEKVFVIPPFQRNYEWSPIQCEELFNDIIDSFKRKKNHYMGNIVYYVGSNSSASFQELILIDGQQRITSILLLLCAIRDKLPDGNDKELIQKKYLQNEYSIESYRVKLKQTEYDEKVFDKIMRGLDIEESEKNSNVFINYNFFAEELDKTDVLPVDIYNTIDNLEIVDVDLKIDNDLETVQKIFEKINSTGQPLTAADLIRNYLLISNSIEEQEKLYSNFWVKLEEKISSENISRFARDYLITKIYNSIPNEKIYKMFKAYFNQCEISHEDVLKEMVRLSNYFNWLKNENCPLENINRIIKMLNLLKSDDMYCLFLQLFDKLYGIDNKLLESILDLLCDFMIRYRIVSPAGGSSDLRTTIYTLLNKISNEEIDINLKSILYELSNSPTPNGRFPDDQEFREKLMDSVNITYARVLLYKMENTEKRNIPVDISKVTIEHVMPQTLNNQWENYFGGKEEAERIQNTYLNCIGNLAPISASYNSMNSNKPWIYKRKNLAEVQFGITSEIAKYEEWNESSIKRRNQSVANRACRAIIAPLKRERFYSTRTSSDEFQPGYYSLTDTDTPMSGHVLQALMFNEKIYSISNWNELLPRICKELYKIDKNLFNDIISKNKIHKSTAVKSYYLGKDPILTKDEKMLSTPLYIKEIDCYVEASLSSDRARVYSKQLLDFYNLTEQFKIHVVE